LSAWSGLRAGDPVDVDGVAGRGLQFCFSAFVTNRATGETWVEVIGGRSGDRKVRSFRPDQVFPPGALRRRGGTASLADQPGLPFT